MDTSVLGLSLLCEGLCAWAAYRTGTWPVFAVYLMMDVLVGVLSVWLLPGRPRAYNIAYSSYRVATAGMLIATAHEAVSIEAKRRLRGDASLSTLVQWLGLACGAVAAILLILAVSPSIDWKADHRGAVAVWRVTSAAVAGWLIAVWFTGRSLPFQWLPASRHRLWLLAYVAVPMILSAAMDAAGPGSIRAANYIHLGWASACYLTWPVIVARASNNRNADGRTSTDRKPAS